MLNKTNTLKGIVIILIFITVLFGGISFYSYWWQPKKFSEVVANKTLDKNQKFVALTFDDGPYGKDTIKILDILKEKNVQATFFIIGENAKKYPEILKRESAEGHVIGNHSFNHSKLLNLLSAKELTQNIENTNNAISTIIGVRPRFFRPPYGFELPIMVKTLERKGYTIVLWNGAAEDYYMKDNSEEIVGAILKKLKPGAIIDLHDGRDIQPSYSRENLLEALPIIIDRIRERGYILVTVDKIIVQDPYF